MKVSELTKLAGLQPDDEVLIVRNDVGPGLAPRASTALIAASSPSEEEVVAEALLRAWPVGCYYKGTQDPSTIIGGSWTEINGRYLYAMESGSSPGSTGGAETVTLTTANLPSHTHTCSVQSNSTHTHTVYPVSHTHTIGSHTHYATLSAHTHTIGSHTHTTPNHRHDIRNARRFDQEGRQDIGFENNAAAFKGRLFAAYGSNTVLKPTATTATTFSSSLATSSVVNDPKFTCNSTSTQLYYSADLTGSMSYYNSSVGNSISAGSGQAHTNMPPTEICRIWRRVS